MEYFVDIYNWLMSLDGFVAKGIGLLILLVGGLILLALTIFVIGLVVFKLFAFFIAHPLGWLLIIAGFWAWYGSHKDPELIGTTESFLQACNREASCRDLMWEAERLRKETSTPRQKVQP